MVTIIVFMNRLDCSSSDINVEYSENRFKRYLYTPKKLNEKSREYHNHTHKPIPKQMLLDMVRVAKAEFRGTVRIQWGYSEDTLGIQAGGGGGERRKWEEQKGQGKGGGRR